MWYVSQSLFICYKLLNLAFALSNYLCGACSFTPDRKTKATALSVHIVRVVLDSIAGHKPIFIALLFQRESSLNAFQLLHSLSFSFILAPLRWLNAHLSRQGEGFWHTILVA